MSMEFKLTENGGQFFGELTGRLDTASSQAIMSQLQPELGNYAEKEIVIECGGLEYISSSGIRLLLLIRKTAGKVVLKDMRPEILQILKVTKLDTMFNIL